MKMPLKKPAEWVFSSRYQLQSFLVPNFTIAKYCVLINFFYSLLHHIKFKQLFVFYIILQLRGVKDFFLHRLAYREKCQAVYHLGMIKNTNILKNYMFSVLWLKNIVPYRNRKILFNQLALLKGR